MVDETINNTDDKIIRDWCDAVMRGPETIPDDKPEEQIRTQPSQYPQCD